MNCIIYARVSTEEQSELSIPAQIQAMRDFARQHDWTVTDEFLEPGVSAKTTARPALQRMLLRIRKSEPPINVLLVHKIDRLARNVYDHATIRALLQQRGIRLASVVENVDDSVSGQLVENIMASIAQFYSANLGEEVKKGMRQKVKTGGWPHLPPIGYQLLRHAGAKSTIEVDPTNGPLIRLAFELYATGRWGVRALADHLRKEGLRTKSGQPLAQSNLRKLLANPFYAGRLRWEGKEYPGSHDPLIPVELFHQVQRTIGRRREDPKAPLTATAFPLKSVAVCASCRGTMTAEVHGAWSYYRCCRRMNNKDDCPSRLTNAKRAHDALQAICNQISITPELAQAIRAAIARLIESRSSEESRSLPAKERQLRQLSKRRQQLTQSFVQNRISAESFDSLTRSLVNEINHLQAEVSDLSTSADLLLARAQSLLLVATDIWALYLKLPPVKQTELLRSVFEAIVLGPEGIVGYILREPFASLAVALSAPSESVSDDSLALACISAAETENIEPEAA